jgi:superfamily I DNA/RNA helicase
VTIRDPNEIFNLTIEVYYLLQNDKNKIKRNWFLKDFDNEDDILEYANEVDDYELKLALKVVKEYKDQIFEFKKISDKFYLAWQNRVNNGFDKRVSEILFLTTAHTAKGLEWDSVTIADDYTDFADLIVDFHCDSLNEFQNQQSSLSNQELLDEFNLFYVAITRAKKKIIKDSKNFNYLIAKNIDKIIDNKIKESKQDKENLKSLELKNIKKISKVKTKLK